MYSKPRLNVRFIRKIINSLLTGILLFSLTPNVFSQSSGSVKPFGEGITAKKFFSSAIDNNNVVWFLTESGIISYDGTKWSLHNNNAQTSGTATNPCFICKLLFYAKLYIQEIA